MQEQGHKQDGPSTNAITQITKERRCEELHSSFHARARPQESGRVGIIVVEIIQKKLGKCHEQYTQAQMVEKTQGTQ